MAAPSAEAARRESALAAAAMAAPAPAAARAAVQALSATLARIGAPGLPGGTGPSYWDPGSRRNLQGMWERTGDGGMPRQYVDRAIEESLYTAQIDPRGRQSRSNAYLETGRLWRPDNVPDEDVRRAGDARADLIYFETQSRGKRMGLNDDQINDAMTNAHTEVLKWEISRLGRPLAVRAAELPRPAAHVAEDLAAARGRGADDMARYLAGQGAAAPAAAAAAAGAPAVAMFNGDANGYPRDLVDQWIRDGIRVIGDSTAAEAIRTHNRRGAELAAIVEGADGDAFGRIMDRVLAVARNAEGIAELRGVSRLNARAVGDYVGASAEAWEYDRWERTRRRRGGARKRTTRRKRRSS
jgi:hypothetical protein